MGVSAERDHGSKEDPSKLSDMKPCPFCGHGEPFVCYVNRYETRVNCGECDAAGPAGDGTAAEDGRVDAINLWNERKT